MLRGEKCLLLKKVVTHLRDHLSGGEGWSTHQRTAAAQERTKHSMAQAAELLKWRVSCSKGRALRSCCCLCAGIGVQKRMGLAA